MSQHTSYSMIFSFCLALGVICLITAFFLHVPVVEAATKTAEIKGFKLSNFIEPKALPIAFVTLAIAFCYSSVLSFINFYAIEINLVEYSKLLLLCLCNSSISFTPIHRPLHGPKRCELYYVPGLSYFWSRNAATKFGKQ